MIYISIINLRSFFIFYLVYFMRNWLGDWGMSKCQIHSLCKLAFDKKRSFYSYSFENVFLMFYMLYMSSPFKDALSLKHFQIWMLWMISFFLDHLPWQFYVWLRRVILVLDLGLNVNKVFL